MITRFGPLQFRFASSADDLSFSRPLPPQPLLPAGKYFGALEVSLTRKMFNDEVQDVHVEVLNFSLAIAHRPLLSQINPRSEYSQIVCLDEREKSGMVRMLAKCEAIGGGQGLETWIRTWATHVGSAGWALDTW